MCLHVTVYAWIYLSHLYICIAACECIWHGSNFNAPLFFLLHSHDILATWTWNTIFFPQNFLCLSPSAPSLLHFHPPPVHHFPVWLACPRCTEMCEVCVECRWSEEAACCPVTLCGLVTLWLCGVAPTCPLALPINYRWNQVPESTHPKHNTISHTDTHRKCWVCWHAWHKQINKIKPQRKSVSSFGKNFRMIPADHYLSILA